MYLRIWDFLLERCSIMSKGGKGRVNREGMGKEENESGAGG